MHGMGRALQDSREPPPPPVDSNAAIILGALLGALVCVVALALLARRAWLSRFPTQVAAAPPQKGLNRKALSSLPKQFFRKDPSSSSYDCPICLSEFLDQEEIRVLPFCGHRFHLLCVDLWLSAHSSCPSCRIHLGGAASSFDF